MKKEREKGTIKPSVFMSGWGIINTPCYASISTRFILPAETGEREEER